MFFFIGKLAFISSFKFSVYILASTFKPTIYEISNISVSSGCVSKLAMSILGIIFKLTLVHISTWICYFTKAFSLIFDPITLVYCSI